MPRKALLTREEVIAATLKLARKGGLEAVTPRALSAELGCSLSPLFTVFDSMDEIRNEARESARRCFVKYVEDSVNAEEPFKEYGMRIIRFAAQEPDMFKIVFLSPDMMDPEVEPVLMACIEPIKKAYSLSYTQAMFIFHRVWIFVCGLAVLNSTRAQRFDEDQIGKLLFEQFHAVRSLLSNQERN